jgi:hypothetical protein
MIRPMGGEEVAVLYPQDGYWRLRPLAPAGMAPTAFGSSFLVGPVEIDGRPIVRIKEVAFDPKARTFTLAFERGGSATVRIETTDQNRNVLDVAFDKPVDGRPFAALRSMYVTEFNNDVARIAVRERGARGWREDGIMAFKRATATDVWAGRTTPSRTTPVPPTWSSAPLQTAGTAVPRRPENNATQHLRLKNLRFWTRWRGAPAWSGCADLNLFAGNQWLGCPPSSNVRRMGEAQVVCHYGVQIVCLSTSRDVMTWPPFGLLPE